ncbi:small ribosomal subunit protein mS39-like [Clavelina lepadiformis]|uniref:small ribosomal subunit protein mS39-like n=1 Tax=Clavelina lepadiformis TaxID=159417 RepID=UPI004042865E
MYSLNKTKIFRSSYRLLHTTSLALNHAETVENPNAKDVILRQLNLDIKLPKPKNWSNTAVLEALSETVEINERIPQYQDLSTPELWLRGRFGNSKKQMLRHNGRGTANYIIQTHPEFFKFDWGVDKPENWTNLDGEFVMEPSQTSLEDSDQSEKADKGNLQDSVESLQMLLNNKQVIKAMDMFVRLREAEVEVPSFTINQLLGLLAFCKGLPPNHPLIVDRAHKKLTMLNLSKDPSLVQKMQDILKHIPDVTDDQIAAVVMSLQGDVQGRESLALYNKHLRGRDTKLHVDVYHHIISHAYLSASFRHAQTVLEKMKRSGVRPTYKILNNMFRQAPSVQSPSTAFQCYAQILNEMKELGIEPGPATYAAMVTNLPLKKYRGKQGRQMLHTILDLMKGKHFHVQDNYDIVAFIQILQKCGSDMEAVKKVYDIVQYGKNSLILDHNERMQYMFYLSLINTLKENDTVDNLFDYIRCIIPYNFFFVWKLKHELVDYLVEKKRPDYLPFLYSEFPHYVEYFGILSRWLEAVMEMYDAADDDTRTQFKHIAVLELKHMWLSVRRNSRSIDPSQFKLVDFLLAIVLKSGDDDAILLAINTILDNRKMLPTIFFTADTIKDCKAAVDNSGSRILTQAVNKLEKMATIIPEWEKGKKYEAKTVSYNQKQSKALNSK